MGLLLTFQAADPDAFLSLHQRMATAQSVEEASVIWDQLAPSPHADFSLNLPIPDHTDALCQAMIAEGLPVLASSLALFGEPLWSDEVVVLPLEQFPPGDMTFDRAVGSQLRLVSLTSRRADDQTAS